MLDYLDAIFLFVFLPFIFFLSFCFKKFFNNKFSNEISKERMPHSFFRKIILGFNMTLVVLGSIPD